MRCRSLNFMVPISKITAITALKDRKKIISSCFGLGTQGDSFHLSFILPWIIWPMNTGIRPYGLPLARDFRCMAFSKRISKRSSQPLWPIWDQRSEPVEILTVTSWLLPLLSAIAPNTVTPGTMPIKWLIC